MLAVSNLDGFVTFHDAATLQEIRRITVGRYLSALTFSPDGQYLFTGGDGPFINIWDTGTGRATHDLLGSSYTKTILALAFSPNSQTLYALESSGTLRRWDMSTLTSTSLRLALPDPTDTHYYGVINLAANRVVITGHSSIEVADATTGALIYSLGTKQEWRVAINAQGTRLAAANFSSIDFWDLETGQHLPTNAGHNGYISDLAFSPDGQSLASSGGDDGTIRIWPVP